VLDLLSALLGSLQHVLSMSQAFPGGGKRDHGAPHVFLCGGERGFTPRRGVGVRYRCRILPRDGGDISLTSRRSVFHTETVKRRLEAVILAFGPRRPVLRPLPDIDFGPDNSSLRPSLRAYGLPR